jgi:threonine dehydratase
VGASLKRSRHSAQDDNGDSPIITLNDIREAQSRLNGVAVHTRLIPSHIHESSKVKESRRLYLKPENLQPIGSFKLRGAYNKVASLSEEERRRGVITYSSGNHAQGVAYAARALGVKAVIVMPGNAPAVKREATIALGAEIILVGPSSSERQAKAEELAAQYGYVIVPPYNDEMIIAGQGTMGLEILADLPEVETIIAPVGGGGMLSGIATAIKLSKQDVKVIGAEPAFAADAQASLRSGKIVQASVEDTTRTLADGLRTQSIGAINFEHIRRYVDDIVTVTEDEIRRATQRLASDPKTLAEPSGAVAVAAFLFHRDELPKTTVNVAVISGGNIEAETLAEISKERS